MLEADTKNYLLTLKPFQYLNSGELDMLVAHSKLVSFAVGDLVLEQGKISEGMYIILEGQALVAARVLGRGIINLASLDKGSFVGEISLIERQPCTATVIASTPLVCLLIATNYFAVLPGFMPEMRYRIMKGIVEAVCVRIRATFAEIRSIMKGSAIIPRLAFVELIKFLSRPKVSPSKRTDINLMQLVHLTPFDIFTEEEFKELLNFTQLIDAPKGAVLVKEKELHSPYYIVLRGAVQATMTQDNKVAKLVVLGPVSLFGSINFIDNIPSAINYAACEHAILLKLDMAGIEALKKSNMLLWYKIFDVICQSIVNVEQAVYKFYLRLNSEHYVGGKNV